MSASPAPFSLRIFVANGDPDGLRLVERSNWVGKAVMFPRSLFTSVRIRPEFEQTGVYLLLGPHPDWARKWNVRRVGMRRYARAHLDAAILRQVAQGRKRYRTRKAAVETA